ncbi:MAG: DUF4105 domain-containing protein [Duncaniella sp.]|nr:DUF4105 domain-containing protein [Duncaniella sp.]
MLRCLLITFALLLSLRAGASDSAVVSLLTCSEGREIYELEGHTGLRIQHPLYGDFTVNWGVFDFDSPGFVYRFVKGETDYIAAAVSTDRFLQAYRRQGRTVREQTLRLTPEQTDRLVDMIMTNIRPENRVYRYNYVLDNCATRPLVMIEKAIGDTVTLGTKALEGRDGTTFRNVMRHFHRNYPWYQFGIDTALGSGIDRSITRRETGFAPVVLADMIAGASTPGGEQLTLSDGYLIGSSATPPAPAGPTPWTLTPMFWASVIFLLAIWVSIRQKQGYGKAARWFDTLYFSLCGTEGLLLTFLIFVSVHEATSPNWLYLWLNPLCFIGAVSPWLKRGKGLEICYQSVNFACLIALAAIFLAGVQSPNTAFWPLMIASAVRSVTNILTIKSRHNMCLTTDTGKNK